MTNIVSQRMVGRTDGTYPTARYCPLSGDDCWDAPHVHVKLGDGWYCYVSAHAWNSATQETRDGLADALRAEIASATKPEAKSKSVKE